MREIKMFSDFACPFCYIGFSIMDRLRKEEDIELKHIPLLLNPDESLEGSILSEHVPKETINDGYERIENLGEEYGLKYDNRYKRFSTNRLHKAALYAEENDKYFEFTKLGFEYVFTHAKNVGRKEIVDEIASSVGLDLDDMNRKIDSGAYEDAMKEAEKLADEIHVTSVPTFVVDGKLIPTRLEPYKDFKKQLFR